MKHIVKRRHSVIDISPKETIVKMELIMKKIAYD